jgi:hypothetical protein
MESIITTVELTGEEIVILYYWRRRVIPSSISLVLSKRKDEIFKVIYDSSSFNLKIEDCFGKFIFEGNL